MCSLTLRYEAHRGDCLRGVMDTAEIVSVAQMALNHKKRGRKSRYTLPLSVPLDVLFISLGILFCAYTRMV